MSTPTLVALIDDNYLVCEAAYRTTQERESPYRWVVCTQEQNVHAIGEGFLLLPLKNQEQTISLVRWLRYEMEIQLVLTEETIVYVRLNGHPYREAVKEQLRQQLNCTVEDLLV